MCWLKRFSGYLRLGEAGGKAEQMSHHALQNWRSGTHPANSLRKSGNMVWVQLGPRKGQQRKRESHGNLSDDIKH